MKYAILDEVSTTLDKAIGVGLVAGMRTFTAPALTSIYLRRKDSIDLPAAVSSENVFHVLTIAAAGELVADKLPSTPARISRPSLVARLLSGAICGACIYRADDKNPAVGGLAGGISAAVSAYATYRIRRELSRHVPDVSVALAEDALAVAGGAAILGLSDAKQATTAAE